MGSETFPPELWMQVAYFACTDDGTTGRSLSQVSRQIRESSRPYKMRSIVIRDVHQLISFVRHMERLPDMNRTACRDVEFLYIAACHDAEPGYDQEPMFDRLEELYVPNFCDRNPGPAPDEIVMDLYELVIHAILRALKCVALTVKNLHIYTDFYRDPIFFPIAMDNLEEMTLQGPFEGDHEPYVEAIPALPRLRRLKMTDVFFSAAGLPKTLIPSITVMAPYLSHLYFECSIPYTRKVIPQLQKILHPPKRDEGDHDIKFPCTLHKLYLHSGDAGPPYGCGTGLSAMILRQALEKFCMEEPNIVYFRKCHHGSRSPGGRAEGEEEWLERINGGLGAWDDSQAFHGHHEPNT